MSFDRTIGLDLVDGEPTFDQEPQCLDAGVLARRHQRIFHALLSSVSSAWSEISAVGSHADLLRVDKLGTKRLSTGAVSSPRRAVLGVGLEGTGLVRRQAENRSRGERGRKDSNPRLLVLETSVLPTELLPRVGSV
jgi:hypothetical protein